MPEIWGLPGRWSICLAENEEESPWRLCPLAEDGGQPAGASAVSATLLRTCEFVDNRHTPDPEQILADIADTISRTGSLIFRDTSAGVVFCPEHAQMLATAGFTKQDVQAWLIEHCGRTGADLRRAGKNGLRGIARFADADTSGPGRHLYPHPAVPAARPDRGGGRPQRGDLDGGPDLRRVVRHRDRGHEMIDTERAGEIAATLAADGYHLAVAEAGNRVRVTITAGPDACADFLVPENLMRGILGQALGVPQGTTIDLAYPIDSLSTPRRRGRRCFPGPAPRSAPTTSAACCVPSGCCRRVEAFAAARISAADLRSVEDQEIPGAIKMQEEVGLQSATDGEFRRASWHMDFIYAARPWQESPRRRATWR